MILLGLLLVLGLTALAAAAFMNNDGLFSAPAGSVELFGYHAEPTVGQVFLTGAGAGVLMLIGLFMVFGGAGRRARRRLATRRELQAQRAEVRDLQRKHDSMATKLAAQRTADDTSVTAARERGAADAEAAQAAAAREAARDAEDERVSTR